MTHWLDLSQVYGSSATMARDLRELRGGRLRVGTGPEGQMLPDNPTDNACKGTCFKVRYHCAPSPADSWYLPAKICLEAYKHVVSSSSDIEPLGQLILFILLVF